ncbi:uncharacterized protein LOC123533767 [Mercenaria mercenaria]|uniref:uncharacterized protein LOC123533767 n=1 Tax=Mercenaria mercenaria TaxID=6596 RepID=UPI00234EA99F|nr:uncharacterized protein LOC123533767 [Mercenaria mercenaria]
MADRGRHGDAVFFIYDHNMLKKEEDDLKDAILFFTPDSYSIEDQCALCGQLMGISEFLKATISRSAPHIFRFEHDKFALKRTGAYTFVLKGGSFTPDSLLYTQLSSLYETFITYHGSIDSLKLRCKESTVGFLQELSNIWRTILQVSNVFQRYNLEQTFQSLPYIQLPKSGSHLFLQASHLLQSSQRRPYVLAGTILYKNGVLSTQLPPKLTKHLIYLRNQMPHIVRKTDCELPVGCRIITVFLTDEELSEISPLDSLSRHHCKVTDFSVSRQSDENDDIKLSAKSYRQSKSSPKRRLTCPNLSLSNSVPQKALHSYITNGQRKVYPSKQESVTVDNYSWSNKSKLSLSHVPIVECKTGESPVESDVEILYARAKESHFGESYRQISRATSCENEQSETDSENDEDEVLSVADPPNDAQNSGHSDTETKVGIKKELHSKILEIQTKTLGEAVNSKMCGSQETDIGAENIKIGNRSGSKPLESGQDIENISTVVNISTQSKTDSQAKLEGKKSEKFEPIDLLDASKVNEQTGVLKGNSDSVLKRRKHSKVDKSEENPSISDLDEDTDDEMKETPSDADSFTVKSPLTLKSNDIEDKDVKEHGIENKLHPNMSDETSVEESTGANQTEIALSNSSSEVVKSRFYDCMSDTETKTLKKGSDHAIHQHTVDVHVRIPGVHHSNSHEQISDIQKQNSDVSESENGVETASYLGGKDNDHNFRKGEKEHVETEAKVDHVILKGTFGTREQSNILNEQKGNNSVTDSYSERKPTEKDKGENTTLENSDDRKENIDPIRTFHDTNRYESEIETEDESVTIATIEPCINCLELLSKQPEHRGAVRCSHCIARFNKEKMFGANGNDQEIIDFGGRIRDRYESGTETEGQADVLEERRGSGQAASLFSSLSSDMSTDSTISRYWTHEMEGLNDVTLYVQCHSDISLLLLMENPEQYEESLFHSLWKGSLAHLADLDFYIKECMESSDDDDNRDSYRYLKYDMFAADLRGTIEDPGTDRKNNNLQQMLASLHTEFQQEECLSDVLLRSHFNSCYGHSNQVEEAYFQSDLQQKLSSGFPIPRDPVFNLDTVARQQLAKDRHLSLL